MASKVMDCHCNNDQQNALHGKGRRVFNAMAKEDTYRCTSCGTEKNPKMAVALKAKPVAVKK